MQRSCADLPGEEWRDVAGFEDQYEVSNMGRVYSKRRQVDDKGGLKWVGGRLLTHSTSASYPRSGPSVMFGTGRRNRGAIQYVRKLVWEAFKGPVPEGQIVRTCGNPDDTRLSEMYLDARQPGAPGMPRNRRSKGF